MTTGKTSAIMDIQAILDESSDSGSDDDGGSTVSFQMTASRKITANFLLDEVSENDDEDESTLTTGGHSAINVPNKHNPEEWAVLQAILNEDSDDDDDEYLGNNKMDTSYNSNSISNNTVTASRADPAAVTARNAIATTSDELLFDTDEDDLKLATATSSRSSNMQMVQVDAILQSMDNDNDVENACYSDVNIADESFLAEYKELLVNARASANELYNNRHDVLLEERGEDEDYVMADAGSPSSRGGEASWQDDLYGNSSNAAGIYASSGTGSMMKNHQYNNGLSYSSIMKNHHDHFGSAQYDCGNGQLDSYDVSTMSTSSSLPADLSLTILKVAETYEQNLLKSGHRDIISPLMVKRRMKPKIELPTRSRTANNKAVSKRLNLDRSYGSEGGGVSPPSSPRSYYSANQSRFNFAGIIESRSMPNISREMLENARNRKTTIGLPTALAVNSKFIATGTQRGVVLVFDLFGEVRQKLGKSAGEGSGSVTSIDLSVSGETIIAGYTSGIVVWWDVIKGSVLKSISDSHHSPITIVRFVNETSIISVDASGLVYKLNFSKAVMWANYSVDSECLLDGTAGQILSMHILPPLSSLKLSPSAIEKHCCRNLSLIALSSERSSFAVAVEPSVNVLHRWARVSPGTEIPAAESSFLPCLAWGWALISGGGVNQTPVLARAWGSSLQLLQANFPPDDDPSATVLWPAFGVHDEFETPAPVVALEWLGERTLIFLTTTNEFNVVDTVMMTLIERSDFSGIQLVYAEFSLSSRAEKERGTTTPKSLSTTFQNSIRAYDKRLLILCQEEVKSIGILGAKRRIAALEEDGEWLEALALALDHYESAIKSLEDRQRAQPGDFSRHPEFASGVTEEETWIAGLLMRYVKIAIENAPEAHHSHGYYSSSSFVDLSQSHYQMLAGVCIDFCVVTKRLDLLFGKIYRSFQDVRFTTIFFDVLEPYLLNDKLRYVAPEVLAQFIEHCMVANDTVAVERCLLHMDGECLCQFCILLNVQVTDFILQLKHRIYFLNGIFHSVLRFLLLVTIMDFHSILGILRKNRMYSALIHVYAQGLDDFISPLRILMEGVFDAAEECDIYRQRNRCSSLNRFEKYGLKALLFIQYSLANKTFPQSKSLPDDRIPTLRAQLLQFLIQENYVPETKAGVETSLQKVEGHRAEPYPYLTILILLDAQAVLDALALALDAPGATFAESTYELTSVGSSGGWEIEVDADRDAKTKDSALGLNGRPNHSSEIITGGSKYDNDDGALCPDRQLLVGILSSIVLPEAESQPRTMDVFLDFMAKYLVKGVIRAPKSLTFSIISRMVRFPSRIPAARRIEQEKLIALLEALPPNSYDREEVLSVVEGASMNRAALLLHKLNDTCLELSADRKRHVHHFVRAIECYLEDFDDDFRRDVYDYIKNESVHLKGGSDGTNELLRKALWDKIPMLVQLDNTLTAQMVAEMFVDYLDEVLESLAINGSMQYKFLHSIISGDLVKVDSVAGQVMNTNLTDEHRRAYLVLLARFNPEMVYHYLASNDNYDAEECLKLCQEHEIADASAYLLERLGNVTSALQLILQTLEGRMMTLKKVVRANPTSVDKQIRSTAGRKERNVGGERKEAEVQGMKQMLMAALELCERNYGSEQNEHGPRLWFNVLDRLMGARGFLRLSKELPHHASVVSSVLNDLLQITMQRMVSNVSLPDLVQKITTDHRSNRLGEFREMVCVQIIISSYFCPRMPWYMFAFIL